MEVIEYLTRPEQMIERAEVVGQFPTRSALSTTIPRWPEALSIPPADARRIIERAVPRPVTPVYTQLSEILQIQLHRALTRQRSPARALAAAQAEMQRLLDDAGLGSREPSHARALTTRPRLAWWLVLPALATILLVALFPLAWTVWESLHLHDLRMPWLGRPFVGLDNYVEALGDPRFWSALGHTALFAVAERQARAGGRAVLALALNRAFRGRGLVRAVGPDALGDSHRGRGAGLALHVRRRGGIVNAILVRLGLIEQPLVWFIQPVTAWVPIILADVWKTTPFVALLLLAGLQSIDPSLYEAARIDGARPGGSSGTSRCRC